MLRGERVDDYVTRDGQERSVCALCRGRAARQGWVPAGLAGTQPRAPVDDRRRRRGGLRPARRRKGESEEEHQPVADDGEPVQRREAEVQHEPRISIGPDLEVPVEVAYEGEESISRVRSRIDEEAAQAGNEREGRPAGRSEGSGRLARKPWRDPRHVRAIPTSPEARIEQALEIFNAGEHPRTVAGVSRSLGEPRVSAGALASSPSQVRLTVAWDLSWYQWAIDLSEQDDPVRTLAKGSDVDELDGPAREWNAHADEDGLIHPGTAD